MWIKLTFYFFYYTITYRSGMAMFVSGWAHRRRFYDNIINNPCEFIKYYSRLLVSKTVRTNSYNVFNSNIPWGFIYLQWPKSTIKALMKKSSWLKADETMMVVWFLNLAPPTPKMVVNKGFRTLFPIWFEYDYQN